MGLRDTPRHTLLVQLREPVTGSAGQTEWRDAGSPVQVRGNLHPASTDEIAAFGVQTADLRRFHCLEWPGDSHSVITYDGRPWDVVAPPQHFDMSPRTAHWEVLIRRSR